MVEVDVRGREYEPARAACKTHGAARASRCPGRDLRLTLDMELMRVVERAFRGHPSGARGRGRRAHRARARAVLEARRTT